MGASWGVAGLTMPVVGWAVDSCGLAPTLMWLPVLMVVAGVLALAIPDKVDGNGNRRDAERAEKSCSMLALDRPK